MPHFVKIGRDIIVGEKWGAKHWAGAVVFGRDAIYVCPNTSQRLLLQGHDSAAAGASAAFGLVGALIAGAVSKAAPSNPVWTSWVMDLSGLPADVTANPDWPLRKKGRPVILVKRDDVTEIRRKGGKLLVSSTGGPMRFGLKFFGRSGVLETIKQLGWRLTDD